MSVFLHQGSPELGENVREREGWKEGEREGEREEAASLLRPTLAACTCHLLHFVLAKANHRTGQGNRLHLLKGHTESHFVNSVITEKKEEWGTFLQL